MQSLAQTYDGYVENGRFYPRQSINPTPNRFLAILTVIDVPITEPKPENNRMAQLDDLMRSIREDSSPKLRTEDFPRFDLGREPIVFVADKNES